MASRLSRLGVFILTAVSILGCTLSAEPYSDRAASGAPIQAITLAAADNKTAVPQRLPSITSRPPGVIPPTPTPDAPWALPTPRRDPEKYTVRANDTLAQIARRYGVDINLLVQANQIANPDRLFVGQALIIPAPTPQPAATFKTIPDSELVFGPSSASFDLEAWLENRPGYLKSYQEDLDGMSLSGAVSLLRAAREFSVNPRLLAALLEYQGNWISNAAPTSKQINYPFGVVDPQRRGLYRQAVWAANSLNRGYYLLKASAVSTWSLTDGAVISISPRINPGTSALQYYFSLFYGKSDWEKAVGPQGFFATYQALFGYPFDYALEPQIPDGLSQPPLTLPFAKGETWAFTGGPHAGWADGSPWAALDFAPPDGGRGCVSSEAWVTAAADGLITRAANGAVIQDLDSDGLEQTGWTVLYMHIESRDRVSPGAMLKTGERIGHPSCEGGVSNGTHVHLARKYNGEWIPAGGSQLPINLDGWVARSTGIEYNGKLVKNGQTIEAWDTRKPENQIQR